jgi:hypothetical protein
MIRQIIFLVFLSSIYTNAKAQGCNTERLMIQQNSKLFQFAPAYSMGYDSLQKIVEKIFYNKRLLNSEYPDWFMIIVEVNAYNSISKFDLLIPNDCKKNIFNLLSYLKDNTNSMWCPGYFYYKKTEKKQIQQRSQFSIQVFTDNGYFHHLRFVE